MGQDIRDWTGRALVGAALLICATTGDARAASEPVGMVMKVTGETTPKVPLRSELLVGTPIVLAPGTRLTFIHYDKCGSFTVTGGKLEVTTTGYTVTDGTVEQGKGPCPRTHVIAETAGSAVAGSILLRGPAPGGTTTVGTRPEMLLGGSHAERVTAASIGARNDPSQVVAALTVVDRQLRLPEKAAALPAGERFVVRVILDGGKSTRDMPIRIARPGEQVDLPVLRLD